MSEVFIPRWHPTPLNKLLRNYWVAARLKKVDRDMIGWAFKADHPNNRACNEKKLITLTIILQKGKRGCDPDAYWKSTLDALVHAGAIANDSHLWVQLAPVDFKRADDWGTVIKVTPI